MIYNLDTARDDIILDIGIQGEDNARQVRFDISAWLEAWPGGTIEIQYKRPEDTGTYDALPSKFSVVDGILTWIIDINQTVYGGYGYAIITYRQGGIVRKSPRFNTLVKAGLPPAGPAPDTVADWIAEANTALNAINTLEFSINEDGELLAGETVLGRVSDNPRGDYNPDADPLYSKRDIVFDNGGSYRYINDTPSNEPTSSTSHWQQIAEKGDRVELTGPWDELTTYSYYQSAEFYGSSYIYINATPSAGHTPLDTNYWMLWAARGEQFVDTTNLTWQGVRDVVRQGLGPKVFPVGTVLRIRHTTYGDILWRVMAHNHDVNQNAPELPTMRLEMISCIYNRQADAPELLWANTGASALPAGTYNFTLLNADNGGQTREDGTYQFTTAQAIPVGGGFRHSQAGLYRSSSELYVPANLIGNYLTTYNASGVAIESNLSVTAGSGGTALGTASRNWADTVNIIGRFNSTQRNAYGSNHAGESGVRQWLNSALGANLWWVKKTPFDLEPSYANQPGFLAGFDADFLDALVTVDNVCARNTIYEEGGTLGGSYITTDKMFRPSMTELGLGVNNAIAEGAVLDYYDGTTALERIKFDIVSPATARYWWLRSPSPSNASGVRTIGPDGALSGSSAYYGHGVAPDCVIG